MRKPLIGVVVGAVVYFVWGMVSWMVLPWHNNTIRKLPEEQLIMDTIKTVVSEPGFYFFPNDRDPDGKMDQNVWMDKYRKGPIGVLAYSPNGKEPMGTTTLLFAFIGNVLIAAITMLILLLTRDRVTSIVPRAILIMTCGLVVGLSAHLSYWNWFNFPWDYTKVVILDSVISFLLLGFAQAMFVPRS